MNDSFLRLPLRAFILVALFLTLSACQDKEPQDLKEFVANAYKDKKPEIKPLPVSKPYKPFAYSANEIADPFNSLNIITDRPGGVAGSESPDTNRRREPLEEYPLDALKMVGTLTAELKPWVIVQTSDGVAYRATVGNYMGQNEGKIKEIIPIEQKIVLAELVLDPVGRWVTRELEITIDE